MPTPVMPPVTPSPSMFPRFETRAVIGLLGGLLWLLLPQLALAEDSRAGEAALEGETKSIATDPIGDTFGSGAIELDLSIFEISPPGDRALLSFGFSQPVGFPGSGDPDAVHGYIDIDLDRSAETGILPWTDRLRQDGGSTGLGTDIYIDLSTLIGNSLQVFDATGRRLGFADFSSASQRMAVSIPIELLGGDTDFAASIVVGTAEEATDVAPNQGALESDGLLLQTDRFRVDVEWRDFEDRRGEARLSHASDDSAVLYFFTPDNWELLVKVLDGCTFNDRFWVFYAATTNVEFTVTVTDTETGTVAVYTNPLGQSADAVTDTEAFATCSP